MIKPTLNEAMSISDNYCVIPISKEIYADIITPITLLRKLNQQSKQYYLLESVEGTEKWGRYSFLGFDPIVRLILKDNIITIIKNKEKSVIKSVNPMEKINEILKDYKTPRFSYMPPFTGGFVGYFSYNMIGYAERVLNLKKSEFNDFDLMLFDKVIAYDHLKQKIIVMVNMKTSDGQNGYKKATDEIDKIIKMIVDPKELSPITADKSPSFVCNLSKESFCSLVNITKQHIKNGDIFQAVISRRFEAIYKSSLLNAYRVLRSTNPSPYMFYIQTGDTEIAGTSPETLIKLANNKLTTFPVAGTRPRGKTIEEDLRLETELLADEKELAEHNMLVDLARNDLGRISKFTSVKLEEYKSIHRYSKVMHITSVVSGEIRDDKVATDAISAMLPAGTLSGAPKIRACEIIDKLEPNARGIYGGAIGYIDFSGNMDTCIAIRMAVKKGDKVYVQAGGGIVADSIPENEYIESENKAMAIINAIFLASGVDEI